MSQCENYYKTYNQETAEYTRCEATAVVRQYDCCDNYNTSVYCQDCSYEGGSTDVCEWEVCDLDGNVLATNMA